MKIILNQYKIILNCYKMILQLIWKNNKNTMEFYTGHGPKPSTLSQLSSKCIRKITTYSCHISFFKTCRDHDLIPRGLRLKDPIGNSHSESTLHDDSLSLLKQRLNHYRTAFIQQQQLLKTTMDKLQQILTDNLYNKLLEMHKQTASVLLSSLLTKHDKKFSSLLLEFNLPFLSPYSLLQSFNSNIPTISGPLISTTPLIKPDNSRRTVINLTDTQLTTPQTELLSLGLKFSPTEVKPKFSTLASKIESSTRTLSPAVENAIVNDISNIFQRPSITKPNLKPHLSAALKSLQRQKNTLKITRADKGNATVIMTQKQYNDKILEHLDLDCYTPLNKDPTDSLNRKLDSVLKKLLKENKIDKPFFDSCRTSNPRRPQLYGLPKIHKPGNPIRPIVSYYNTPLSSLHKQLSIILKPLTISPLRLKDSSDFTDPIGNIKSAPAKHSHDMQHNIDWSNTTILTTAADRHQLNLLEHAAISTYNPPMNRQHKGPRVSPMWTPILNKITSDFSPTTADIRL